MRLFGLIGYPLGHSFSKGYFSNKFKAAGIEDVAYENFPIPSIDEFTALFATHADLEGVNVTIPYKQAVMPLLDEIHPDAAAIGAVNCVAKKAGKLIGYNTDVIGFKQSLEPLLKDWHQKALVLGTGGAAKAVVQVLQQLGIAYQLVSSKQEPGVGVLAYHQITQSVLVEHTVIVNTTPLGMSPNVETYPDIPYQYLSTCHLAYDLVYNPSETQFMQLSRLRGAVVKNGYDMLVMQAEASWAIWNNQLFGE